MICEKRQVIKPEPYQIPAICFPRQRKKKPRKKIPQKCQYQIIPMPLKTEYKCEYYTLYGGVCLKEHNGTISTETTLFNTVWECQAIQVEDVQNQKIISLLVKEKSKIQPPPWQYIVERLENSDNQAFIVWSKAIKRYCLKFEEMLRAWPDVKKDPSKYSEAELEKMMERTRQKAAKLFHHHPCIIFKNVMEDTPVTLGGIVFNDKYLHDLGYSIENFTFKTLQEGIPSLLPSDNTEVTRTLMDKLYSIIGSDNEYQTSELHSELIIKKEYVRKVKYKAYYLPTYENKVLGFYCLVAILDKEPPMPKNPSIDFGIELNKKFVNQMIKKEKQANKFLKEYYDTSINLEYTDMNKVCKIKHLDVK